MLLPVCGCRSRTAKSRTAAGSFVVYSYAHSWPPLLTSQRARATASTARIAASSSLRRSARCSSGTTSICTRSLAAIIGKQFFTGVNETTAFIFALLAFAAGFAVRPFGAMIFGRLGDMAGRKYTFLITIVIMGVATALVGMLPGHASIGVAAPIILITLRLLQGLAVGGEYGGAATYIAEHAPPGRRAYYTSWIQITATAGMILSLHRDPRLPLVARRAVRNLGLARAVPALDHPAGDLGLHPPAAAGIAGVPRDARQRQAVEASAARVARPVEQSQAGAARAVRRAWRDRP